MACWDMRFQLPISSHCHPSRARIRRLSMHPLYQSWVIAGKMEGWLSCVGRFSWKVHNNLLPKLTVLVSYYIWTECLIVFWLWRLPLLIPHCHLIFIMFKNDLVSHHHYSPFLTVHHHLLSFFSSSCVPYFCYSCHHLPRELRNLDSSFSFAISCCSASFVLLESFPSLPSLGT